VSFGNQCHPSAVSANGPVAGFKQPNFSPEQGDQIGRIFARRAIVYFGHFFKSQK
jgi:hypothetical protein